MKKLAFILMGVFLVSNIIYGQTENNTTTDTNLKVATYLYFNDNAKEAIETYKSVFGAEVVREHQFVKGMTKNEKLIGKIFHAELKIGDLNLYLSDSGKDPSFTSMKFVVEIRNEEKAKKCFKALAKEGKVKSEFKKMPYGPTIATVIDKFGIVWDIVIC